jgi:hypothetical protein
MGSLLFRAEWSSRPVPSRRVGAVWRNTETSLIDDGVSDWRTGLHSLATLEVSDPSLGGDERFDFTRLISDTTLTLATGHERGVRLRARLAGGSNVPRQKEQALGGWSALRGFGSNEFRGDWSLFGTLEYRQGALGGFLDLGSVREPEGWTSAKIGVGAKLYLGSLELVTAVRTDGGPNADPQLRVFLGRGF